MIKHALLGLLARRSMHGYELKEEFTSEIGEHWSLNFGQIYTTLDRLYRDGLVNFSVSQDSGGPDKKVYSLTIKGLEELKQWFFTPTSTDKRLKSEFYIKFILSLTTKEIDPKKVLQIQRKKMLEELHELTKLKSQADSVVQVSWVLLLDSACLHIEADLRWLDMCEVRLEKMKQQKLEHLKVEGLLIKPRVENKSRQIRGSGIIENYRKPETRT